MTDRQREENQRTQDTLILQKVNQSYRTAFRQRFPGQIDHILRLIAERLQAVLLNKPENLADPSTWAATPAEIASLSDAMNAVYQIHKEVNGEFRSLPTQEK